METKIAHVINSRQRDLGGFVVRRVLPYAMHRMVGPFIFFDHMGPATFAAGQGIDVRPHPHIGLATLTYLFEGVIRHRDSLGSDQLIEAGAVNWMIAGRGIVHSERTPEDVRKSEHRMNGIQCWIALPKASEETAPEFSHYPKSSIPEFIENGVRLRLLAGRAFGRQSPVKTFSDLCYLEAKIPKGAVVELPSEGRELGAYIVQGKVKIGDQVFDPLEMVVGADGSALHVEAVDDAHVMIVGGEAMDSPRRLYWNFVSSSQTRIEAAKKDWKEGRFPLVPGDSEEFIPLPEDEPHPNGTIL